LVPVLFITWLRFLGSLSTIFFIDAVSLLCVCSWAYLLRSFS
jgi:hypothetical protein